LDHFLEALFAFPYFHISLLLFSYLSHHGCLMNEWMNGWQLSHLELDLERINCIHHI
jgi:hypothetical protein